MRRKPPTPRQRDVYIAIMVAAAQGVGLRLSPQECIDLSFDQAIAMAAVNGLAEGETDEWSRINPYRKRIAANQGTQPV